MPKKCCVVACRIGYKKKKVYDTEEGFITKIVFDFPAEVDLST